MPGELPKSITYKYDLMHLNTPSFASSVVTWDTSKLTPITKKRVINALKEGYIKFHGGDAATMYGEIRKRFEIPEYTLVKPSGQDSKHKKSGFIQWEQSTPKLMALLDPMYQAERVAKRLEGGWMPWYLTDEKLTDTRKYFHYEIDHDMTEVEAEIHKIMTSTGVQKKRDEALSFVLAGGKIEFTYKV